MFEAKAFCNAENWEERHLERSEAGCLVQRHQKPLESWHGSNDPGVTVFCLSCCSLVTFAQIRKGFEGSAELSSQTFTLFFVSFTKGKVGAGLFWVIQGTRETRFLENKAVSCSRRLGWWGGVSARA